MSPAGVPPERVPGSLPGGNAHTEEDDVKHLLTILVPTFAVMTALTAFVLVRTHALAGLRSRIEERLPKVVERLPEIIEEVLE
jgi:hypothetical protein